MPIRVEWGNVEQTILSLTFANPWTWDDFYEMRNQIAVLCREVDYIVDATVDMSKGRSLPSSALTHLSKGAAKIPPNQGVIVAVGMDTFLRSMADMVIARTPHLKGKFHQAKSPEEAYKLIMQIQAERGSAV